MEGWEWLFQFIDPLEIARIDYAIVGSVAASIYGEPRATNDLDLVIQIESSQTRNLCNAFPAERFYVPPEEAILAELTGNRAGHINIIALESMTKADLYPLPAGQRAWFARRRQASVADRRVWLASPEVIILHKLLFYQEGGAEKHLRDIRAILATTSVLDRPWIEGETQRLGTAETWHGLLK